MADMKILVTGGAGYIGSHACVALLESGFDIVVVDNFSNSKPEVFKRIEEITGQNVPFVSADLLDESSLKQIFHDHQPDAVIHFAGLKAVGESESQPIRYWHNNVGGTAVLLQVMEQAGVRKLVFSSSATVYGVPENLPVAEDAPLSAVNPYGRTKLAIEEMLVDLHGSDPRWNISILRYFNPVGAHPSGKIGEDPLGLPNNLMPFITQVAVGRRERLSVFGDDYDTRDGSCIRDYIHVLDLVDGHLRALEWLKSNPGLGVHNLGTGQGQSVLEMVAAFERASGTKIPHEITGRRAGDTAVLFADASKAGRELNWRAARDIDSMCADAWNWQQKNPQGY